MKNTSSPPSSSAPAFVVMAVLAICSLGLSHTFRASNRPESASSQTITSRTVTSQTAAAQSTASQNASQKSPSLRLIAARDGASQPVQATEVAPKVRWVRAGLSTQGSAIVLYSRGAMIVTDALQQGRKLAVKPGEQVTFYAGPNASVAAKNRTFSGTITVRTDAGDFKAWQMPRVQTSGLPTHISSNGKTPKYQRAFRGHFEIAPLTYTFERAKHLGNLRLVNIIPLEEYLRGVVPWEMNAGAPLEALKAQAVCARSETLYKIANGRHAKDGYEICDYDHCQGYAGTENESARTDTAVAQTAGMILWHNGRVADAVYGTNSGGITAASEDVWRGAPRAYLKSKRDFASNTATAKLVKNTMSESDWAKYCSQNWPSFAQPNQTEIKALASRRSRSPHAANLFQPGDLPEFYRWSRLLNPFELGKVLSARHRVKMSYVSAFQVKERAPSGRIKKLNIVGHEVKDGKIVGTSSVLLEGDSQIRAMVSGRLGSTTALPSSTFVVTPRVDKQNRLQDFVVRGAGWGHGVGMCQRGAQNRAKAGWNARQILEFYYTDVEIRKLQ